MSGSGTSESQPRLPVLVRIWLDAAAYAVGVGLTVLAVGLVLGIAFGGTLVLGKQLLFVAGWLLIAYATLRLWPSSPSDLEQRPRTTQTERSRVQATIQRLPPVRWMRLPPPARRLRLGLKLFLAGFVVLVLSFLMEMPFGVR